MKVFLKKYKEVVISAIALTMALLVEHVWTFTGSQYVYLVFYGISYLAVGGPVWIKAYQSLKKGNLYSEFFLMGIATIGAFAIGEYAEGVAVMLFYMIGEYAQHGAVHRARHSIKKLIDEQPDRALVERNGDTIEVHPSEVKTEEIIKVRPGEKVPLDGVLISERASFNTSALTGESKPATIRENGEVWAGYINEDRPVRIRVTAAFEDTKLSGILEMVQDAAKRKAPTQRFISRLARVYTPVVVWLAVGVTFLPWLVVENYVFQDWFYRALIFLVVSCPCGLVISVPLGYFGGIGAASRNGILFKGSDFLDRLRRMKTLYMDKTGTMTKGVFEVQKVMAHNGMNENEVLSYVAALERDSTHPIAKAILKYANGQNRYEADNQQEISGKGLSGQIAKKEVLVGNRELLEDHKIEVMDAGDTAINTLVYLSVEGKHTGTVSISDQLKEDSVSAIKELRRQGVGKLVMLSGDNQEVVSFIGNTLGVDEAHGGLLPDDKYRIVNEAIGKEKIIGFVGDGVNDAPVITLADVGIAMGGIGSDATVETADVVIQADQPSKISLAIDISRYTHRIVWQNISFALGIKVFIMILAAFGLANMWAAIFADVGVALIAIVNAIRIQGKYSGDGFFSIFNFTDSQEETEKEAHTCCDSCG
ncbi:MAG: cadmium-translocating P-type ATPase [Balneolaceae bacterium]|nr:cadmium-translocating P-type ATPase [Balneolaceae bacterium]